MNILIVDDMENDRKMLRRMIRVDNAEYKISEASNIGRMYAELAKGCELLFLDISLNGNKEPDDEGLIALYDIIDSYPALPICMVTGYFIENVKKFFDEFLSETRQIVNFLDKGSYDVEDLVKVIDKAQKYRADVQEWLGNEQAAEDLLEELAAEEKKRIQEQVDSKIEDLESQADSLKLMKKAFEGNDWKSRIEAESIITGGICQTNAACLSIEIDRISLLLCGKKADEFGSFYRRAEYLTKEYSLAKSTNGLLNEGWSIRNKIVHAEITASKPEAEKLYTAVQILEKLNKRAQND